MSVHKKCIARLSRYRKVLLRLRELGFEKVFSDTIGESVGVTASQVRKDFSLFGITGNRRGGYQIDFLIEEIENVLGLDEVQNVIIAGVGNIGNALMKYKKFDAEGIRVLAGFDIDPSKINPNAKIPIFELAELEHFVRTHHVQVGIIAVPDVAAQAVCDIMLQSGIQGILNFSTVRFKGAEEAVINNVNLQVELENVIYFVHSMRSEMSGQG